MSVTQSRVSFYKKAVSLLRERVCLTTIDGVNFGEAPKGTVEVGKKSPARIFNNTYGERLT